MTNSPLHKKLLKEIQTKKEYCLQTFFDNHLKDLCSKCKSNGMWAGPDGLPLSGEQFFIYGKSIILLKEKIASFAAILDEKTQSGEFIVLDQSFNDRHFDIFQSTSEFPAPPNILPVDAEINSDWKDICKRYFGKKIQITKKRKWSNKIFIYNSIGAPIVYIITDKLLSKDDKDVVLQLLSHIAKIPQLLISSIINLFR